MRNLGDKSFFPEVITLRYPCANLCASNENQSSIYRQPPICKKQLWNNKEQIHSDQNNVIRYGNSVGLVWEKVFVSVFRVKLSKEHTVAIRYWGSSSQTPSLFWARQRNSRIFRKKHQLRSKLNNKRCFKCAAQHTIHHSFIGNAYIACPQLIIAKHYFDANCPKIRCSLP